MAPSVAKGGKLSGCLGPNLPPAARCATLLERFGSFLKLTSSFGPECPGSCTGLWVALGCHGRSSRSCFPIASTPARRNSCAFADHTVLAPRRPHPYLSRTCSPAPEGRTNGLKLLCNDLKTPSGRDGLSQNAAPTPLTPGLDQSGDPINIQALPGGRQLHAFVFEVENIPSLV